MRRKKRYGVYSNATIKRCYCKKVCGCCKSICKSDFPNRIDPESYGHNWYFGIGNRDLHQQGFGSLLPGKRFVPYEKHHGFKYAYLVKERMNRDSKRKHGLFEEIQCEIQQYKLNTYIESIAKKNLIEINFQ